MIHELDNLFDVLSKDINSDLKFSGKYGIEKESLRVKDSKISQLPHPETIGSSLFNSFITTDFSESLLEFVTPPLTEKKEALIFLDDIHLETMSFPIIRKNV